MEGVYGINGCSQDGVVSMLFSTACLRKENKIVDLGEEDILRKAKLILSIWTWTQLLSTSISKTGVGLNPLMQGYITK